jgi:hypothetical protein
MVAGTGLPIKERAPTLLEPPPRAQISTAGAEMLGQAVSGLGKEVSLVADDMQKMEDARNIADIRRGAMETAQNVLNTFRTDPGGVDTAMRGALDKQLEKANPRYFGVINDEWEKARLSIRDNAMTAAYQEQRHLTASSIAATINRAGEQAAIYAFGGHESAMQNTLRVGYDAIDQSVASKMISPEEGEVRKRDLEGKVQGERLVGSLLRLHEAEGSGPVLARLEELKNNPALPLSMQERERVEARVMAEVHRRGSVNTAEVHAVKEDWKTREADAKMGTLPSAVYDDYAARFEKLGAFAQAREVRMQKNDKELNAYLLQQPFDALRKQESEMRSTVVKTGLGPVADANVKIIQDVSARLGANANEMIAMARIESTLGTHKDTNDTTKKHWGVYQLDPAGRAKAKDYSTPEGQIEAGIQNILARKAEFVKFMKREPEVWELYMAHQQGVGGFRELSGNRDANAIETLAKAPFAKNPNEGPPDQKIIKNMPEPLRKQGRDPASLTAGEFLAGWKSHYESIAAKSAATGGDGRTLKLVQDARQQQEAEAKSDPMTFAAKVLGEALTPIDWRGDEDAIVANLTVRQAQARTVAERKGMDSFSPLTKTEQDTLNDRLSSPDFTPQDKLKMIGAIRRGMGPDGAAHTFEVLGKKRAELVIAGELAHKSGDMGVARKILEADDPTIAPYKAAPKDALSAIGSKLADLYPLDPARQNQVLQAALNVHAVNEKAKGASLKAQVFNSNSFKDALKEVIGETVVYNGKEVPAPVRGMTQQEFQNAMLLEQRTWNRSLPNAWALGLNDKMEPVPPSAMASTELQHLNGTRYAVLLNKKTLMTPTKDAQGKLTYVPYVLDFASGQTVQ